MRQAIAARLDRKTGRRVLCGMIECGAELAVVYLASRRRGLNSFTVLEGAPNGRRFGDFGSQALGAEGDITFGPGWYQDETGRWRLTPRALARLMERRHRPAYRHATQPPSGTPTQARRATTLPTEAICPHCSTVNELTDAALGLDELRRQADQEPPI